MENLKDLLALTLRLRTSLECGEALRPVLTEFFKTNETHFSIKLSEWLFLFDQTGKSHQVFVSHHAQILVTILAEGLGGHAIYERLLGYEEELLEHIENVIQQKLDALPYILMVPLLLLMFPAYLILILGPVLNNFIQNM